MSTVLNAKGEPSSVQPRSSTPAILPALAALAIEGPVMAAVWRLDWPPAIYLATHALVVVSLVGLIAWGRKREQNMSAITLVTLATAAMGPMGALLSGLMTLQLQRALTLTPVRLQAWYDRIALSTQSDAVRELCDQVAIGRSIDLTAGVPPSFATVLQTGSLVEKQVALGLIARNFHPDYLPPLQTALLSPEPVIRAQAAAVAAYVRDLMGKRVADARDRLQAADAATLGSGSVDLDQRQKLAQDASELKACMASGLMDESDRQAAASLMPMLDARAEPLAADLLGALASLRRDAHIVGVSHWPEREAMLMSERQFGQVRLGRLLLRLLRAGPYTVRRRPLRAKHTQPRAAFSAKSKAKHRRTLLQLAFAREVERS